MSTKGKKRNECKLCALLETPPSPLAGHLCPGLGALEKKHRKRIDGAAHCSVSIDGVLPQKKGQKIFDYMVVSATCQLHLVEDHSASSTRHITEMREKKQGTEEILRANAHLKGVCDGVGWGSIRWHWTVSHGSVAFHGKSKEAKQIALLRIGHPTKKAALS